MFICFLANSVCDFSWSLIISMFNIFRWGGVRNNTCVDSCNSGCSVWWNLLQEELFTKERLCSRHDLQQRSEQGF